MTTPLSFDGVDFRQFSSTDFEGIQYALRVAFANQVRAGGQGSIFVGTGGTRLGQTTETNRTQRTNSRRGSFPAFPGTGTNTTTTFFGQNRTTPGNPGSDLDTYLFWTGSDFQRQFDFGVMRNDIIEPARTQMLSGDQVGTYRVSTTSPGSGWSNVGRWFFDRRYNNNNIDYRLWLRTSAAVPAGVEMMTFPGSDFMGQGLNPSDPLIQSILLPLLTQRMPLYTIPSNASGSRGSWTNTQRSGTSNTRSGPPRGTPGTYSSISTPSGGFTTTETDSLEIS